MVVFYLLSIGLATSFGLLFQQRRELRQLRAQVDELDISLVRLLNRDASAWADANRQPNPWAEFAKRNAEVLEVSGR